MWLEGIQKIALNTEPYIEQEFNPKDSGFTNQILFIRDSGETETSTGSPDGYIYLNGIKYGAGLDTYINSVSYLNEESEDHPYSLQFNYIDGTKDTFYVKIDDIENIYNQIVSIDGDIDYISGYVDNLSAETSSAYTEINNKIQYISSVTNYISGAVSAESEARESADTYILEKLSSTIISASYEPYSSTTSGAILNLYMMDGNVQSINIDDIDYIIEEYQPRIDSGLQTESKSVSGAINEIYDISKVLSAQEIYTDIRVTELETTVSAMQTVLNKAYVSAYYDKDTHELNLIRYNGEHTIVEIQGGGSGHTGHCHCCCPIVEIMRDGDSWINKLGRRVTELENIVYNQSGSIENIYYCCDDLEKRVRTIENELDLDNNMIIDYTTVPVSAWSLNTDAFLVTSTPHLTGFPFAYKTTEEGDQYLYPYVSLNLEFVGKTQIDLYADFDGDITIEDFGVDASTFKNARVTKNNGKIVTISNFNSLQSYLEDFTSKVHDATVSLKDGDIVCVDDLYSTFLRVEYISDKLEEIGINSNTFASMECVHGEEVTIIDDLDDAIGYIISHVYGLYNGDVQISFVLDHSKIGEPDEVEELE